MTKRMIVRNTLEGMRECLFQEKSKQEKARLLAQYNLIMASGYKEMLLLELEQIVEEEGKMNVNADLALLAKEDTLVSVGGETSV